MKDEEITKVVKELLKQLKVFEVTGHSDHHAFIQMLMEREQRRIKRWDRIKGQVIGWAIITAFGAIGTTVYKTFFGE